MGRLGLPAPRRHRAPLAEGGGEVRQQRTHRFLRPFRRHPKQQFHTHPDSPAPHSDAASAGEQPFSSRVDIYLETSESDGSRSLAAPPKKAPASPSKSSNDIWSACQSGDVAYVHTAIQQSPELLHLEQKGRTPLWHACRHNHVACAALLLEAGAADEDGSARNATTSPVLRNLLLQYQRVDEELKSLSAGEGEQQLRKANETQETLEKSGEEEEEEDEEEDEDPEDDDEEEESASEEEEEEESVVSESKEEVEQEDEQELLPQESFEVVEKKKKRWALPRRGHKKVNVVSSSKMVQKSATAPTTAIYSEALDTSFEATPLEDSDDYEGSETDAAGAATAAATAAAAATMDSLLSEDTSMTDSRKAIVQKNARWISFKNGGGFDRPASPLRWFQNKSNSSSPSRSETSVDDVLADLELASKASTSVDFRPKKKELGQEEVVSKIDPMVDVKGDHSIAEWITQKLPKHQVDGAESVAGLTHLGVEVDDHSKASTQRSTASSSRKSAATAPKDAGSVSNLTHMGVEIEEDQRSAPASFGHPSHRAPSPLSVASFRPGGKVIPVYADGDDESQVLARLEDMRRYEDQRSAASWSSRKSRGVHSAADEDVAAVEERSTASSGLKSRDTPSSRLEDQRSAASWTSRKSHGVHSADDDEVAAVEDQRSTASSGLKSRDAPSTRSVSSSASSFRRPGGKVIPVYADDDNEEVASSYASKATPGAVAAIGSQDGTSAKSAKKKMKKRMLLGMFSRKSAAAMSAAAVALPAEDEESDKSSSSEKNASQEEQSDRSSPSTKSTKEEEQSFKSSPSKKSNKEEEPSVKSFASRFSKKSTQASNDGSSPESTTPLLSASSRQSWTMQQPKAIFSEPVFAQDDESLGSSVNGSQYHAGVAGAVAAASAAVASSPPVEKDDEEETSEEEYEDPSLQSQSSQSDDEQEEDEGDEEDNVEVTLEDFGVYSQVQDMASKLYEESVRLASKVSPRLHENDNISVRTDDSATASSKSMQTPTNKAPPSPPSILRNKQVDYLTEDDDDFNADVDNETVSCGPKELKKQERVDSKLSRLMKSFSSETESRGSGPFSGKESYESMNMSAEEEPTTEEESVSSGSEENGSSSDGNDTDDTEDNLDDSLTLKSAATEATGVQLVRAASSVITDPGSTMRAISEEINSILGK